MNDHRIDEAAVTEPDPAAYLRVLRGLHTGGQVTLVRGAHLIGSGEHCDLVLDDDGIAEEHVLISVGRGGVQVRALMADVEINGARVAADQRVVLADRMTVRIGGCLFGLFARSDEVLLADDEPLDVVADEATAALVARPVPVRSPWRIATLSVAVAALLIGSTVALQAASKPAALAVLPPTLQRLEAIATVIGEYDLKEVRPRRDAEGGYLLEGYVPNQTVYHELRRRFAHSGVKLSLFAVDELLRYSRELLAARGFETELAYEGQGVLAIGGADADAPGFADAVRALAGEVPGVRSARPLVREVREARAPERLPPPVVEPPSRPAVTAPPRAPVQQYVLNGINSVNVGEGVPYLSNGKHYVFAGGTLQNGMTVRNIDTDRVTVQDRPGGRVLQLAVR